MRTKKWIKGALKVKRRRKGYRAAPGHRHRKSVRVEAAHKGSLHRLLGVPEGQKIPLATLQHAKRMYQHDLQFDEGRARESTLRGLRQINLALTMRKFKHKHHRPAKRYGRAR